MVNLTDNMSNVTEVVSKYPIKSGYIKFILIITIIFVGLGLLLFFFSKFNQLLAKKAR